MQREVEGNLVKSVLCKTPAVSYTFVNQYNVDQNSQEDFLQG